MLILQNLKGEDQEKQLIIQRFKYQNEISHAVDDKPFNTNGTLLIFPIQFLVIRKRVLRTLR